MIAAALNREWIARQIPHHGRMCLLEEVIHWDEHSVRCRAVTHRNRDHPLRAHGRLGAACGIEYAAQAMAVHGALTNPGPPRGGYLASVRGVRLHVARLDDVAGDLVCEASRIAADGAAVLYRFSLHGDGRELASGRAAIVFDASLQVTA